MDGVQLDCMTRDCDRDDGSADEEDAALGERKVLRDTEAYKTFLRYFGGCGTRQKDWRECCIQNCYSTNVNPTMEAFLVLCYVNVWNNAVSVNANTDLIVQGVNHPPHVFTSEGKGSPLRGGWNKAGRDLYEKLVVKIREQRDTGGMRMFEIDLLNMYQKHYRARRGGAEEERGLDLSIFTDLEEV